MKNLLIVSNLFFLLFSCSSFGMDRNEAELIFFAAVIKVESNHSVLLKLFDYAVPKFIEEIQTKKESDEWSEVLSAKNADDFYRLFIRGIIDIVDGKLVLKNK